MRAARNRSSGSTRCAKTTPTAAALRIIEGIENNQPRILIGNDARFMDLLQRFRPATYWSVLARRIEKERRRRGSDGLTPSPPHQLIGEIRDGLAVDRGVIPLAHRLEIGAALAVGRAHLEAVGVQQIGGGGEHVGDASGADRRGRRRRNRRRI